MLVLLRLPAKKSGGVSPFFQAAPAMALSVAIRYEVGLTNLDPSKFNPKLARNRTIVLLVGYGFRISR